MINSNELRNPSSLCDSETWVANQLLSFFLGVWCRVGFRTADLCSWNLLAPFYQLSRKLGSMDCSGTKSPYPFGSPRWEKKILRVVKKSWSPQKSKLKRARCNSDTDFQLALFRVSNIFPDCDQLRRPCIYFSHFPCIHYHSVLPDQASRSPRSLLSW